MSKNTKITGGRKTIILKDEDVLEMINEIARLPDYEGNFNKIMNHAIKFGIVTLYERIFDGRAIDEVKDNLNRVGITRVNHDAWWDGYKPKEIDYENIKYTIEDYIKMYSDMDISENEMRM